MCLCVNIQYVPCISEIFMHPFWKLRNLAEQKYVAFFFFVHKLAFAFRALTVSN